MGTAIVEERFSRQLRESTSDSHRRTEQTPFMAGLVTGELDRTAYLALLGQLRHVYAALEASWWRHETVPGIRPLLEPRLRRLAAIDADLKALGQPDPPPPLAATTHYAQRLCDVGARWTAGWVAHHYTRYLGDVSGGQVLRRTLKRHYGIEAAATTFLDFAALGPLGSFKATYRATLDALPWDAAERARVVQEAVRAFEHNHALFTELLTKVR